MRRLTLAELESLAGLGLTGFLALYSTRVAGHETLLAQCALVLGVDLHQGAGDSQTKGLGLSLVTAPDEVNLDVILLSGTQRAKRLLNDVLQDGVGEVVCQRAFVDCDFAIAFLHIYASDSGFAATYCINLFHASYFSLLMSITLGFCASWGCSGPL